MLRCYLFVLFVCFVSAGLVRLKLPPGLVCQSSSQVLKCTTEEDLRVTPTWSLHRDDQVFDITNGTESDVTSRKQESTVVIKNANKKWAGMHG